MQNTKICKIVIQFMYINLNNFLKFKVKIIHLKFLQRLLINLFRIFPRTNTAFYDLFH